jgi:hypothetical protein
MGEGGNDMKSKTDHGSKQGGKTRSLTEIHYNRSSKMNAGRNSGEKSLKKAQIENAK